MVIKNYCLGNDVFYCLLSWFWKDAVLHQFAFNFDLLVIPQPQLRSRD